MEPLRPLDFRVLGPLEVLDGDRTLAVGRGRQKALLALLLLHRGEALSTDRIVDALWEDRPPTSAANSVHVHVSSLRKAFGAQQYFVDPQLELDYLALNTSRPLFANLAVRQAVNYAVDRTALTRLGSLVSGLPSRATSQYLPPGVPGFRNARVYPLRPDLARARRLAGHRRRTAVLYVCNRPPCPQIASLIRAELRPIGIDVEAKALPFKDLFARAAREGEPFDMVSSATSRTTRIRPTSSTSSWTDARSGRRTTSTSPTSPTPGGCGG